MINIKRLIASLLYCLVLLTFFSSSHAETEIPVYKLMYKVEYKGTDLGKLLIEVKNQDSRVIIHGETFPNALASLIGDGKVVELIEYQKTDAGLKLIKVTEKKGHNLSDVRTAEISPLGDRIEFEDGKYFNINPSDQLDAQTFPFLALMGLNDSDAGEKEKVVSSKRIRQYVYKAAVKEIVTVPGGSFASLKTVKQRTDGSKSINVWITESTPHYPLKIEVLKKGKRNATISFISKQG